MTPRSKEIIRNLLELNTQVNLRNNTVNDDDPQGADKITVERPEVVLA